jgi:hypothetical protein
MNMPCCFRQRPSNSVALQSQTEINNKKPPGDTRVEKHKWPLGAATLKLAAFMHKADKVVDKKHSEILY